MCTAKEKARNGRQLRGSASSRSRYDDEHLISPPWRLADITCPVVFLYNHGMASSVLRYDDEHVIGAGRPLEGQRDPYVYGSRGQIMGRREDGRHDNNRSTNQTEPRAKVLASNSTMTRDDRLWLLSRDEKLRECPPTVNTKEQRLEVQQCENSTSRYDNEHPIGSTSSGLRSTEGLTEKDPLSIKDKLGASSPISRYHDEHIMQAEPEHKTRMFDGAHAHGIGKSAIAYDGEHGIGASSLGGLKARL